MILTQHVASATDPIPRYMEAFSRRLLADGTTAKQVFEAAKQVDAENRETVLDEVRADWDRVREEVAQLVK